MRTLRYETVTAASGDRALSPVVDLASGNITTLRRDAFPLLGRACFTTADSLDDALMFMVIVVDGWAISNEDQRAMISAAAANGVDIYLSLGAELIERAIADANTLGVKGVFVPAMTTEQADAILDAGLMPASDLDAVVGAPHSFIAVKTEAINAYDEAAIEAISVNMAKLAYGPAVRFYLNSDSNHWPGESDTNATTDITISAGTVVDTDAGVKLVVVEDAVIASGSGYVDAYVSAIDPFGTIETHEITGHSFDGDNVYVTNTEPIEYAHSCITTNDYDNVGMTSFMLGVVTGSTTFLASPTDPLSSDIGVYLGRRATSASVTTSYGSIAWMITTDIGQALFVPARSMVRVWNHLFNVVEHHIGGSADLQIRTAKTAADLDTMEWSLYSNDVPLDRFVQVSTPADADISITVTLTDDGDSISYEETGRMVDQLPLWMKWREEGSTAYEMTNIVGAYINDLFGFDKLLTRYHLADLDETINGVAVSCPVDMNWVPAIGEVSVDGVAVPMAANADELIMSRYPAFFVEQGYLWIVRAPIELISVAQEASPGDLRVDNLWTHFDEWGLMFGLDRHRGEGVVRFKERILDVFKSGFGSNKTGLLAAAIRELSPVGLDDNTFSKDDVDIDVYDLDSEELKDTSGFPKEQMVEAVRQQRIAGVHTWDNARAGAAIFDADGPGHEGQGRLPYIYDTPLDDLRGKLSSGAGPKNDLVISKTDIGKVSPKLTLKLSGYEIVPEYSGKRLSATIEFTGVGDFKKIVKNIRGYKLKVKVTTNTGKIYYRTIIGSAMSNVDANATVKKIGYSNTRTHAFDILKRTRTGGLVLVGSWVDGNGKPAKPGASDTVTALTIENLSDSSRKIDAAHVKAWFDTTYYSSPNYVFFSGVSANGTPVTGATGSPVAMNATALNAAKVIRLHAQTSPFDASGAIAAQYVSKPVTRKVTLYDRLGEVADLTGNTAIVTIPSIRFPSFVTNHEIVARVVEVVPLDNDHVRKDVTDTDVTAIDPTVLASLKASLGSPIALNMEGTVWRVTHTPDSSWPYVRPAVAERESTRAIYCPKIGNLETITLRLQDAEIPSMPNPNCVATSLTIESDTPGILSSLSGNDLTISRVDDLNTTKLMARRGYFWIEGEEGYLNTSPMSAMFQISAGQTVNEVILAKQPAPFSMTRVFVDGVEWKYRFYQGDVENGEDPKVFSPNGFTAYNNSFYILGRKVILSDPVTGPVDIQVIYEPFDTIGQVDTGIVTNPLSTWDDRFFVMACKDEVVNVARVELTSDRTVISASRGAAGCRDSILLCARALDIDGNPVAGKSVVWSASAGNIIKSESITGADGRATAYYSNDVASTGTIFANIGGTVSDGLEISAVESVGTSGTAMIATTYPSAIMSNTAFVAKIQTSQDVPSMDWSIYILPCEGTRTPDGEWPSSPSMNGTLNFMDGQGKFTKVLTTEGLYKMKIGEATLVWRVY